MPRLNEIVRPATSLPSPVYVIAEAGVNHNGDVRMARELIGVAKECGADAVKFQTFSAAALARRDTPKVAYQRVTTGDEESHFEMLRRLEMPLHWHPELVALCRQLEIDFLSTPYDPQSVRCLDEFDVPAIKVASADLVDHQLIAAAAATGRPLILATGMATLGEVEAALMLIERRAPVVLLQCTSAYPCDDASVNLRSMTTLARAFGRPVGYSDHSVGNEAAIAAVALGACVIERHLTLDTTLPGPDHRVSSDPKAFAAYVASIRRTETILGSAVKQRQPEEEDMARVSRKSIFVARPLSQGDVLTADDVRMRRPGTGILGMHLADVIGRRCARSLQPGDALSWADLD